jgi:hypothetical protein
MTVRIHYAGHTVDLVLDNLEALAGPDQSQLAFQDRERVPTVVIGERLREILRKDREAREQSKSMQ